MKKESRQLDEQLLSKQLLEVIPEIADEYFKFIKDNSNANFTEEDIAELRELEALYGLSSTSPGVTLAFESVLVPKIVEMSQNSKSRDELMRIFDWIEKMAQDEQFAVRNLVAGSICTPLITTYSPALPSIRPHMGKATAKLCKMQFSAYRITEQTQKLFENAM